MNEKNVSVGICCGTESQAKASTVEAKDAALCCGGPSEAGCCAADAEAKASGYAGCGCDTAVNRCG